jgi:hypothetical protein
MGLGQTLKEQMRPMDILVKDGDPRRDSSFRGTRVPFQALLD